MPNRFAGCPSCSNTEFFLERKIFDNRYESANEAFEVWCCTRCALRLTGFEDNSAIDRINEYYPAQYGAFNPTSKALRLESSKLDKFFFNRCRVLTRRLTLFNHLGIVPNSKVLDVGCGSGAFGSALVQKYRCSVTGIEPDAKAADTAAAKGLNVFVGTVEQFVTNERYDLILLVHSLEHVTDPSKVLVKVHNLLKPGGRLVVAVPNYSSIERNIFGRYWDCWDMPRHLSHFCPHSLNTAISSVGFIDCETYYEAYSVFRRSVANWLWPRVEYHVRKLRVPGGGLERVVGLLLGLFKTSSAIVLIAKKGGARQL